jgi:hypothetical protein
MKYTITSRTLCLVFHSLIVLAFGCLGIYFGFFVTPLYLNEAYRMQFTDLSAAYNLYLELGVVGLSLFTVSLYGLVYAIKGFLKPNDDEVVVKSLTAFVCDGYIASVFFVLQALVFFDLTANGNVAFVVIMAIVIAILLLVATNIPVVRLYDGRDQKPLVAGFLATGAVVSAYIFLDLLLTLIISLGAGAYANSGMLNTIVGYNCIGSLVSAALLIASAVMTKKGSEKTALTNALAGIALIVAAALFIANGAVDIVTSEKAVHLEGVSLKYTGPAYAIMSIITGALLVAAGILVMVFGSGRKGKQEAKA